MLGIRPRITVSIIGVLGAALVATTSVEQHRVHALQQDNAQLALEHTNDSAAIDTTRLVSATNARLAKLAGDSLRIVERLVVQVPQASDAVDRALQLERRGRYQLTARLDSLQRVLASRSAVTEDTLDHVRRAEFQVRQAPYTVAAAVALPAPPDTARLDLRIALDPIPVVAWLSCAKPDAHGIRAASIEASAPQWAAITFDHVEQSPDLCASPALTHAVGRSLFKWNPVVIGGGYVAKDATHRGLGVFIGTGFAIGST